MHGVLFYVLQKLTISIWGCQKSHTMNYFHYLKKINREAVVPCLLKLLYIFYN